MYHPEPIDALWGLLARSSFGPTRRILSLCWNERNGLRLELFRCLCPGLRSEPDSLIERGALNFAFGKTLAFQEQGYRSFLIGPALVLQMCVLARAGI